jgi:ABC-type Fe3+-hydroxamate transport system substrate-binding protein
MSSKEQKAVSKKQMPVRKNGFFYAHRIACSINTHRPFLYFAGMHFTDQLNRTVILEHIPRRIISLVPSQTELLADLGLEHEVVGITKFCIHPHEWFRTKERIGGTKHLDMEKIKYLNPDLILANKEENVRAQIEELTQDFPVWISDVSNLDMAVHMITEIGSITGRPAAADMVYQIRSGFEGLKNDTLVNLVAQESLRTAYLIWRDPYMTVGLDTFIHDMMRRCGFDNVYGQEERYPQLTLTDLRDRGCQLVLLSSEPFPFNQMHAEEINNQLPGVKVLLVDGTYFSWYGSRLLKAPGYFKQLQQQIASIC